MRPLVLDLLHDVPQRAARHHVLCPGHARRVPVEPRSTHGVPEHEPHPGGLRHVL